MSRPDAPALHDLLILGGGPAGASAALVAGRASLDAVLVDAGTPRNAVVSHTHGLLTRDGVGPAELRRLGREDLARYPSLRIVEDRVVSVVPEEPGFRVVAESGAVWRARRLLLATGTRDHLDRAGLPGLASVYGRSVFPCPFCDGFEHRSRRIGVFIGGMAGPAAAHYLGMVGMLSNPRHTVFSNGAPVDPAVRAVVQRMGNALVEARVARLEQVEGALTAVHTDDGAVHPCEAGFIGSPFSVPASDVPPSMGVPEEAHPFFRGLPACDADGRTSVPGLYVAGDARVGFGGLVRAMAQGAHAASVIVAAIAHERFGAT